MKFARILVLLLLIHGILPQASYANPDVPTAATLAWDKLFVSTAEGIDVWLRINVIGAAPTENVNLKFIYQTKGNQATANDDYVPTNWPDGTKGAISGTDRSAYVKIDILTNTYSEPIEQFQVELRSDSSSTVISGPARLTIAIARSRIMNPAVGTIESCIHVGESNNNFPVSSGEIAASGGWCNSDFSGETVRGIDYYRVTQSTTGKLTVRLENTTPDQHDLDLYLYYRDGNGQYQAYQQSINSNQLAEVITDAPIAANTNYLVGVYWASSSGSKVPTYRVNVTFRP
ncbi:PPC domain-containing protein [Herpetosiphon llansteffanensis]